MLNWLGSLVNRISGANKQLWNDIMAVIMTVFNYLYDFTANTLNYASQVGAFSNSVYAALLRFVLSDYSPFKSWIQQQLFNITVRDDQDFRQVGNDIAALQARTDKQITIVQQTVSDGLSGLLQWIIRHVFNPLFSDVTRALDWIANEGTFLLDLITHPDKLILYLLKFLAGEWRGLADQYGKIVIKWIMNSLLALAPEFIAILEDIIARVLLGGHNDGRA